VEPAAITAEARQRNKHFSGIRDHLHGAELNTCKHLIGVTKRKTERKQEDDSQTEVLTGRTNHREVFEVSPRMQINTRHFYAERRAEERHRDCMHGE